MKIWTVFSLPTFLWGQNPILNIALNIYVLGLLDEEMQSASKGWLESCVSLETLVLSLTAFGAFRGTVVGNTLKAGAFYKCIREKSLIGCWFPHLSVFLRLFLIPLLFLNMLLWNAKVNVWTQWCVYLGLKLSVSKVVHLPPCGSELRQVTPASPQLSQQLKQLPISTLISCESKHHIT